MRNRFIAIATVVSIATSQVSSQTPPISGQDSAGVMPATEPAIQPFAVQFDLPSRITGRTYRIVLHEPSSAAPKDGWPVIYVLDSRTTFGTAAAQVQLRTSAGQNGALVVGVGYPDAAAATKLRIFDMTPSAPLPGPADGLGIRPGEAGGAALFHRFMVEELRPVIARMAPTDANDQSLIGYSLGGLFALGVLFEHPDAYRTIVAGSPSIWWNNRELLRNEARFAAAVRAKKVSTRVLITSNMWEQFPPDSDLPRDPEKRAAALKRASDSAMVDNAKNLAGRLATLQGAPGYRVRYVLFPEESHLTGIAASTSRGVAFTFIP